MNRIAAVVERHPRHIAVLSLAAGLALARLPGAAFACFAFAGCFALLAAGARPHVALTVCAVFVAAGAIGQLRLQSIDADPLAAMRVGANVQLRGYLLEHPRAGDHGSTVRARVTAGAHARQTIEIQTYAPAPPAAAIGAEIVARGHLMPVEATARTPQARAYARYLLRNGVRRRLRASSLVLTGRRRGGLPGLVDGIRLRSEHTLAAGLPPEPAALLRGMVLGGDEGIPQSTTDAFRIAGLTHILAVSGQNVLLLVILVQAIATAFGFGRLPRLLIPVALIGVYVPLCGAQASVVRAGAMGLAGLAALLASRPSSRMYALLLASAAVLAWNPRATADVGAQLSFAAVVGIMAFSRPIAARLARWPRWMAEAFAATTGATLATAPLMAYHFGTFSVVSLAANVAGEPLIGPIVWLGSLAAAVGQFVQPAGALLNAPNEFLLGSLITVARVAASVPGAQLALPRFGGLTLALVSLPVVAAGLAVNGWLPAALTRALNKLAVARPLITSRRPARAAPLLVLCLAPMLAIAVAVALKRHAPAPPPRPSIVFLDIGQGDATLLLGSNGCDALIDGGPPGRGLPGRLERLGVDRLDLMIATHPQLDHDGGLGEIAEAGRPPVTAFLDSGGTAPDPRFARLRALLAAAGANSAPAEAGAVWRCGDLRIDVLGPPSQAAIAPSADPNTRAAVTVATVGGLRLLASGDAESPQLLPLPLPRLDVLKVSHHGSADSGLAAVLARTGPRVAVIEVGRENRFGHPTPQALAALAASGASVFRTDRDGTVVVSGSREQPDGIQVARHAEGDH